MSHKLSSRAGSGIVLIAAPKDIFISARKVYHALLLDKVLRLEKRVPSIADRGNNTSKAIALGIFRRIGLETTGIKLEGQTAGSEFEDATAAFVREAFSKLTHLGLGDWVVQRIGESDKETQARREQEGINFKKLIKIAKFEQYRRLIAIAKAASEKTALANSLGSDYIIKPDVVIFHLPVDDEEIKRRELPEDDALALLSRLRKRRSGAPLLHASISCNLTIRSDRSQDSRCEPTNLIRNRHEKSPHVVVVTGEPLPSRLASMALGHGDIDCVYHFALPELRETVKELGLADSEESLNIMVNGKRLKDISDLPLDLAV